MYDLDAIRAGAKRLVDALGSGNVVAYAVKANSAGSILRAMAEVGTGADVVSGAELELSTRCGIAPSHIVFSGVAKADTEFDLAIKKGVRAIQAEGVEELSRIAARAKAVGQAAPVSLRINPSISIDAHSHVATGHEGAKFGILRADLKHAWEKIDNSEWLHPVGLSTHIGSTLKDTAAYEQAARIVCEEARARRSAGKPLSYVDFGGGFGIDYGGGPVLDPTEFAKAAVRVRDEMDLSDHQLLIEPGRSLVGPYGVLVADVLQTKVNQHSRWILINAGMNDLLRPALYQARHRIEALNVSPEGHAWRVAGPVCESTDDFGEHIVASEPPTRVVIRDAGAYGFVMASEYNGRALPGEVFISQGKMYRSSPSPGSERWIQSRLSA